MGGGVSVRGQGPDPQQDNYWTTHVSSDPTICFFSPLTDQCDGKNLGREERRPLGRFGIESSHGWTCRAEGG